MCKYQYSFDISSASGWGVEWPIVLKLVRLPIAWSKADWRVDEEAPTHSDELVNGSDDALTLLVTWPLPPLSCLGLVEDFSHLLSSHRHPAPNRLRLLGYSQTQTHTQRQRQRPQKQRHMKERYLLKPRLKPRFKCPRSIFAVPEGIYFFLIDIMAVFEYLNCSKKLFFVFSAVLKTYWTVTKTKVRIYIEPRTLGVEHYTNMT